MNRCKLNKTQMISLIKAGAFDNLDEHWASQINPNVRKTIMAYYLYKISKPKAKVNLQNMNALIQNKLLPPELDLQKRIFCFNKFLKSNCKNGKYYIFNDMCIDFYTKYYDETKLQVINGLVCILQNDWDKQYQFEMEVIRQYLKEYQKPILDAYNFILFKNEWDKYAKGTISAWEMESMCFYYHEHELENINNKRYGIVNFFDLDPDSEIAEIRRFRGREVPIYKLSLIMGTVISKNDNRSSVALLTPDGVVTVKMTREYYAMFSKRISEVQSDGKKKVMEEGWFKRGTLLLCTGFRRDDMFITKSYKATPTHQLYKITEVQGDKIKITHNRYGQNS